MTLILAAGNTEQFIQVYDRRLCVDGVATDDESNKAMVLDCDNARLAVGFTGLARHAQFETRRWLLSALDRCGPPDYSVGSMLRRFRDQATRDFNKMPILRNLRSDQKRLTIMFTGYLYNHEPPLGALAIVSNFQDIDRGIESREAWSHFKCFFRAEARPNSGDIALLSWVGDLPPFREGDSTTLRELIRYRKPPEAIVRKLVRIFEYMGDHPKAGKAIGKQLSSIVLPRDRTLAPVGGDYSSRAEPETYIPDWISVRESGEAPAAEALPLSDPKPSQLCWCGSGKKFKRCHRTKK
jgi:hypothetical protein